MGSSKRFTNEIILRKEAWWRKSDIPETIS